MLPITTSTSDELFSRINNALYKLTTFTLLTSFNKFEHHNSSQNQYNRRVKYASIYKMRTVYR